MNKPKFICFKKNVESFSYSLFPKILKFTRPSLRLVVLKEILTIYFFLRIIDYGTKVKFQDLFPVLWNPLYLISSQATKSQLDWGRLKLYQVWNKKESVKKRKTRIKRIRVLQIALKNGENENFAWENFNHSMLLSC